MTRRQVSGRWLGSGELGVRVVALIGTQRLWATWADIAAYVDVAVCVARLRSKQARRN